MQTLVTAQRHAAKERKRLQEHAEQEAAAKARLCARLRARAEKKALQRKRKRAEKKESAAAAAAAARPIVTDSDLEVEEDPSELLKLRNAKCQKTEFKTQASNSV